MIHTRTLILTLLLFFASAIPFTAVYADVCPYSPTPIITEGDSVIVAPGVNGLNMRFLPAVGAGRVVALNQGYPLTVIGGPSCNGMFTWWRVETPIGVTGWVAGGTWETYFLIPAELPATVAADSPPTPFEWTCVLHFDPFRCL